MKLLDEMKYVGTFKVSKNIWNNFVAPFEFTLSIFKLSVKLRPVSSIIPEFRPSNTKITFHICLLTE